MKTITDTSANSLRSFVDSLRIHRYQSQGGPARITGLAADYDIVSAVNGLLDGVPIPASSP